MKMLQKYQMQIMLLKRYLPKNKTKMIKMISNLTPTSKAEIYYMLSKNCRRQIYLHMILLFKMTQILEVTINGSISPLKKYSKH
jgi:hypothetical protein